MKRIVFILIIIALFGGSMTTEAKKTMVPKMYMFGIAASFNDSIIYFTNIQEVDNVWKESKNNFLLDRHVYSSQLREYMTTKLQMPYRTCVVYYNANRTKLEKKFIKIRQLYTQPKKKQTNHFEVRYVDSGDFMFKALDASFYIDEPADKEEKTSGK